MTTKRHRATVKEKPLINLSELVKNDVFNTRQPSDPLSSPPPPPSPLLSPFKSPIKLQKRILEPNHPSPNTKKRYILGDASNTTYSELVSSFGYTLSTTTTTTTTLATPFKKFKITPPLPPLTTSPLKKSVYSYKLFQPSQRVEKGNQKEPSTNTKDVIQTNTTPPPPPLLLKSGVYSVYATIKPSIVGHYECTEKSNAELTLLSNHVKGFDLPPHTNEHTNTNNSNTTEQQQQQQPTPSIAVIDWNGGVSMYNPNTRIQHPIHGLLSALKSTQVVCGPEFWAVQTVIGDVYVYGTIKSFQRDRISLATPIKVNKKGIKQISALESGLLMVTKSGQLYQWGVSTSCKTRFQHSFRQSFSRILFQDKSIHRTRLVSVVSSKTSGYVLDEHSRVFSFGTNEWGQLGVSDTFPRTMLNLIPFPGSSTQIKRITCSSTHVLFLTHSGQVYACGRNDSSQLNCHSNEPKVVVPSLVRVNRMDEISTCETGHVGVDERHVIWVWSGVCTPRPLLLTLNGSIVEISKPSQLKLTLDHLVVSLGGE